jgi:hypothetical protein
MDSRRGALGETGIALSIDLPSARLIRRKSTYRDDQYTMLYIVAVSNADKAVQIIRTKAANPSDDVEDLGHVSGFLVRTFDLAAGEFISIHSRQKPPSGSTK